MILRRQNRTCPPQPLRRPRGLPTQRCSGTSSHRDRALDFLALYGSHLQRRHQAQLGASKGDARGARFWFYVPVQHLGPGAVETGILPNVDDYQRYRLQFMGPFDREMADFLKRQGSNLAPHLLARFFYGICGHYDASAHFHVAGSFFSLLLHKLKPGLTPNQRRQTFLAIDTDFAAWTQASHAAALLPPLYKPFSPSNN